MNKGDKVKFKDDINVLRYKEDDALGRLVQVEPTREPHRYSDLPLGDFVYPMEVVDINGKTEGYVRVRTESGRILEVPVQELKGQEVDNVNHPKHYTSGKYETYKVILDIVKPEGFEAFCIGNVIKYVSRYKDKNGIEDLKKAEWYLKKVIEVKEGKLDV